MRKAVALVFLFALLLVILTPAVLYVNTAATNGTASWADGSLPLPPPPSLTIQWNDGSLPLPPPPSHA